MRVLISVDMEGIAGVSSRENVLPGTAGYERFRRLMTAEANAAIAGAFEGGATSVVVNDAHNGMRNILYEELDERAELISGHNKRRLMVDGVEGSDAAVFIGYHAWMGTARSVLDHTVSSLFTHNWWLNGVRVGEAQLNAAICGEYGVPVVLVSGDDKLEAQVRASLPGTKTLVVKESLERSVVRSLGRAVVKDLLRQGVAEAVRGARSVKPVAPPAPATIRVEFLRSDYGELASWLPQAVRVDDRTVEVTGKTVSEAWVLAEVALRLAMSVND